MPTSPRTPALAVGAALLGLALSPAAAQQQQEPTREITPIAGDLYRFQNGGHVSVFLVTPEGVIATDPINADAATWLENEIRQRFGQEIRYVIYSHDHADHISGGEVFADTATVVAHAQAKADIVGEQRPTAVPDITFSDQMIIELGGKTVELVFPGRSHSDNLIVMRFPEERALFAVDLLSVDRLPFADFPDAYIDEFPDTLRAVEAMDFDVLVPGHGPLGTKEDVAEHRRYVEELRAAVTEQVRAGRSLDEVKQAVTMDAYRDWGQYEAWLPLNIEGMYRYVSQFRRPNEG